MEEWPACRGQEVLPGGGARPLAFDASCWVRLSRRRQADRRRCPLGPAGVRPGIDPVQALPSDWSLEWLIFDALKCNPATAHVRDLGQASTVLDSRADPR